MFDLAVIGAGVMGASVAYHATRKGASVLVIDDRRPGRATTAGAGIISTIGLDPDDSDPVWLNLVDGASEAYRALFGDLGEGAAHESEFATVGELVIARSADENDRLHDLEQRIRAWANPTHLSTGGPRRVAGADYVGLFPYVDPSLNGLYIPGTSRIDGAKFAAMLLSRAEQAGACVRHARCEFSVVRGVGHADIASEPISAAAIVIANGAWAGPFLEASGTAITVMADRGQIVHLNVGGSRTDELPVLKTFDGPYLLGFDDGRIVAGATHEVVTDGDSSPRAGDQLKILASALSVAPGLARASIAETRVGFRPASSDGLPIVGATAVTGTYAATGLGSWGLTLAPLLGDVLTDQILARPQRYNIDLLSPQRTAADRAPASSTVS